MIDNHSYLDYLSSMFVCVCNAVTDRRIAELAASGVQSVEELRRVSGCGDCCGQCTDEAEAILHSISVPGPLPGPVLPLAHGV